MLSHVLQEATKLDFASATVELSNGDKATYDNLILATGAFPTKIPLDGVDLKNIFTVRGVKDAESINAAVGSPEKDEDKKNVVVVGSSFIGMEVALALADKAKVTVLGLEDAPFSKILGNPIGNGIRKFHESKGTKFILPAELSHFAPHDDDKSRVGAVHLKDGTVLPAEAVVIGAGVKPATELLKDAGLSLEKNASVKTDDVLEIEQLKGKHKGRVFALGDVATFDTPRGSNYVQHWNVASNHGRAIAHYIATDKREPFDKVAMCVPLLFSTFLSSPTRRPARADLPPPHSLPLSLPAAAASGRRRVSSSATPAPPRRASGRTCTSTATLTSSSSSLTTSVRRLPRSLCMRSSGDALYDSELRALHASLRRGCDSSLSPH